MSDNILLSYECTVTRTQRIIDDPDYGVGLDTTFWTESDSIRISNDGSIFRFEQEYRTDAEHCPPIGTRVRVTIEKIE